MNILVTGHCGFIGQNFVRLYRDKYNIIGIDRLNYAADKKFMTECPYYGDLKNPDHIDELFKTHKIDAVIHLAAESHVDNSINSPKDFIYDNYIGTFNLLEACRKYEIKKILIQSTDEVYGDLLTDDPPFSEPHKLKPSSPYSATKAASDLLALSYVRTYGMNVMITRPSNNYGPYQHFEKFIPTVIRRALKNKTIPVYGNGTNQREWIYVKDCCEGIMTVLEKGASGQIYNLGSGIEKSNIILVRQILRKLHKPESLIEFVEDRKGHDFRYFLDSNKTYNELGWNPTTTLHDGLEETINWYKNNLGYWEEK